MKVLTTLAAVVALAGSAQAEVVFNNGTFSGSANNIQVQMVADDFRLTSNTILTGASIFAVATYGAPNPTWDGQLDYAIFADAGNKPGALLASGQGQSIARTVVYDWGYSWYQQYRFDMTFESPIAVTAGTVYWFGAHIGSSYAGDNANWVWNFTEATRFGNSMGSLGGTADNWADYFSKDRAFYLTGSPVAPVPESTTAGMAALGLVSLLFATSRARRRS